MNLSYRYTSWGQRYADVVTVPTRRVTLLVRPPAVSHEPWRYVVTNETGQALGEFTWIQGGPNHEFWARVAEASGVER